MRKNPWRTFFAVATTVIISITVMANNEKSKSRMVLFLKSDGSGPVWITRALTFNLEREISKIKQIEIYDLSALRGKTFCQNKGTSCLLQFFADQQIDIVLLGLVKKNSISFQTYETWTKALVNQGNIELKEGKTSLSHIRKEFYSAIKPFIEKGGLLNQKEHRNPTPQDENSPFTPTSEKKITSFESIILFVTLLIGSFLGLIAIPYILFRWFFKRQLNTNSKKLIRWMTLIWILTLSVLIMPPMKTFFSIFESFGYTFANMKWLGAVLGGTLYGLLGFILIKLIFPGLYGLRRILHWNIYPLIVAWLQVSFLRGTFVLLTTFPIISILIWFASQFHLSLHMTYLLFLPLGLIGSYLWVCMLAEAISLFLDKNYVSEKAHHENLWHAHIKKYFISYMKRLGLDDQDPLIDKVLFLPSSKNQILTYGTPFTKPRIVIDKSLIEFALGQPIDHQTDKDLFFQNSNASLGIITPQLKLNPQQRVTYLTQISDRYQKKKNHSKDIISSFTGLLTPLDPITSLSEKAIHKLCYSTNPNDSDFFEMIDEQELFKKDFLFGLLLHQFGTIKRYEHFLMTFIYLYHHLQDRWLYVFKAPIELSISLFQQFFFLPWTIISDSYCALHNGIHHFMQYLYLFIEYQSPLISSSADKFRLQRIAIQIIENIKNKNFKSDSLIQGVEQRLINLSQYFYSPIQVKKWKPLKIGIMSIFIMLMTWFATRLINESISYHNTTYLNEIEQESRFIHNQKSEEEKK